MSSETDRQSEDDSNETGAPVPGPARRRKLLLIGVTAAALFAVGGLGAAALVGSQGHPRKPLATAQVSRQVLTPSVVLHGQVHPHARYAVAPAAASPEIVRLYLSKLMVRNGDQVANGQQLAEVSGQPLFVLQGAVPAYRDLKPGFQGPDVAQLQTALNDLGYGSGGDAGGMYGPGTARAVAAYYQHLGYTAPTGGAATQQAVDTAKQAVETDRRTIDALSFQPMTASPGAPSSVGLDRQLANARQKLAEDSDALAKAETANGPMVPAGEVVFVPALPAAVTSINSSVGAPASGALLSLASGGLDVTGQLDPGQAGDIKPGMSVEIASETSGATMAGKVAELGEPTTASPGSSVIPIGADPTATPSTASAQPGAAYVPLRITPTQPLPASLDGQTVRITVRKAAPTDPVLSVPSGAILTDSAGRTTVTRLDPGGKRTSVPVRTGANANGYTGVTALGKAHLNQGDQVLVTH